jgi:hypothetical protein
VVGVGVSVNVSVSVKVVDERVRMGLRVRVGMTPCRHADDSLPLHRPSRCRPAARRAAARRVVPIAPPPVAPRPAPTRAEKKMFLELMPSLACTSAWGMRQSGREHGKGRGQAGARFVGDCAPLHVEEELAVERRQLQDDVVFDATDKCPSRLTTSIRQKCSVREGLAGVDHMHALEDLAGL